MRPQAAPPRACRAIATRTIGTLRYPSCAVSPPSSVIRHPISVPPSPSLRRAGPAFAKPACAGPTAGRPSTVALRAMADRSAGRLLISDPFLPNPILCSTSSAASNSREGIDVNEDTVVAKRRWSCTVKVGTNSRRVVGIPRDIEKSFGLTCPRRSRLAQVLGRDVLRHRRVERIGDFASRKFGAQQLGYRLHTGPHRNLCRSPRTDFVKEFTKRHAPTLEGSGTLSNLMQAFRSLVDWVHRRVPVRGPRPSAAWNQVNLRRSD